MLRTVRTALLGGASLLAVTAIAAPTWAQDQPAEKPVAAAEEPGTVDEVMVTAQRRNERIQDVPAAISAFGALEVEKAGVISLEQVAPRVPSFYFSSFGATRPQLYIRGIGTRSFDPGSESSVGVFVDDVYMGRSSGSFGSLKDIERIEVLRGPQGTLYGRNTIAGAINVITKGPSSDFNAHVEAGVSNYEGYELMGAVGGPITPDANVMFRVAGWTSYREGYATNLTTGHTFQGVENSGLRARVAFQPTDQFRVDLSAEWVHDGDEGAFGGFNQGTGRSFAGAPANPRAVFFAPASRIPVLPRDLATGFLSQDPTLDRDAQAYILRGEYDFDFATFTSISALRKLDVADGRDLEGSSLDVLNQNSEESSEQFTQEFRLTSNRDGALSFGGKLDWIVGAFYYKDESDRTDSFRVGIDSVVRAALGTPAFDVASSDYEIESYAFFGQATWRITDQLEVTLGGRYSHDEKTATQGGTTTDASPIIAANFITTNTATYDSFDPRLVVTYKFTPDISIYATYSTGFKSGGFQYVPFSKAQADVLFDPEDIETYEVGVKSQFFDRKLTVNAAIFQYDYKDLQVSRIIDAGGAPVSLISNAAASTIKGFDLEVVARPTPNFEIGLAYGYLDAKYDEYVFNATLDFSGTRMVRAPEHTVNVNVEWTVPLGEDRGLLFRADYSVLNDFYHEPGEGMNIYGSGIPLTVENGYALLDLRAAYETRDWRLTAYVTNATEEDYRRTINALGSTVVGFAGQPRIFGVKFSMDF
jgi:iron complex outermembrane receptor protein